MARVKEALKKEVAEGRAKRSREQAEALRKKTENALAPGKRKELETLAKTRDHQASLFDDDDDDDQNPRPPSADADLPRNVPPHTPAGTPKPRNFTDPDSRVMLRDGAWIWCSSSTAACALYAWIIVAAAVSNQSPDNEYFMPMLRRVVTNCDAAPERATADSGYFSAAAVACSEHGAPNPSSPSGGIVTTARWLTKGRYHSTAARRASR